jgi:Protein of unknown function (DUF3455)
MKMFDKFTPKPTFVIAGLAALSLAAAVAHAPLALAGGRHEIVVPDVPGNLDVPAGNRVYLEGHGVGTQNYICMPCPNAITPAAKCPASGFAWAFVGPQATLFDVVKGDDDQITTHFNSTNPEDGKERPTWQSSRDTSVVWGNNTFPPAEASTNTDFVADGAIAWLKLPTAGTQVGPTGGDKLADTTFIQRLNTEGGVAPDASTCATSTDAGKKELVPYSADYFFYKKAE